MDVKLSGLNLGVTHLYGMRSFHSSEWRPERTIRLYQIITCICLGKLQRNGKLKKWLVHKRQFQNDKSKNGKSKNGKPKNDKLTSFLKRSVDENLISSFGHALHKASNLIILQSREKRKWKRHLKIPLSVQSFWLIKLILCFILQDLSSNLLPWNICKSCVKYPCARTRVPSKISLGQLCNSCIWEESFNHRKDCSCHMLNSAALR